MKRICDCLVGIFLLAIYYSSTFFFLFVREEILMNTPLLLIIGNSRVRQECSRNLSWIVFCCTPFPRPLLPASPNNSLSVEFGVRGGGITPNVILPSKYDTFGNLCIRKYWKGFTFRYLYLSLVRFVRFQIAQSKFTNEIYSSGTNKNSANFYKNCTSKSSCCLFFQFKIEVSTTKFLFDHHKSIRANALSPSNCNPKKSYRKLD